MGTFSVSVEVGDLSGSRYVAVDALVDTGATYLVVGRDVLHSLGVQPTERRRFAVADGREITYDVGNVALRMDGRVNPVLAVFGEEGTMPLLGAVPLEVFGLGIDPVRQRLIRVAGLLMAAGRGPR